MVTQARNDEAGKDHAEEIQRAKEPPLILSGALKIILLNPVVKCGGCIFHSSVPWKPSTYILCSQILAKVGIVTPLPLVTPIVGL